MEPNQTSTPKKSNKGLLIGIFSCLGLLVIVFIIIIVVAVIAGSGNKSSTTGAKNQTTKTATKSEYAVNEPITIGDQTLTVTTVQRNFSTGNEFVQPEAGKEYVVVTVKLENNGKDQISFNTFDFQIQDSNGVLKNEAFITGVQNTLSSGNLAPGGKVTGNLGFEVQKDDAGLKLVFKPNFWSNKTITVKL